MRTLVTSRQVIGTFLFLATCVACSNVTAAPQSNATPVAAKVASASEDGSSKSEDKPAAALKVVELKLTDDVTEDPMPDNPFGPSQLNFRARLLMLRQLAADKDVAGVRLKVRGAPDFAHTLDLLDELRAVKAAGKKVVCYAETLSQRDLVFASLADKLMLPPAGGIELEGLQAQVMYLKDLLDKVHLRFEVLHVGNYKSAYEDLARNTMSDEQRQVIGLLLDEFWGQMLDGIAQNRGMSREKLEKLYDGVYVEPKDALAAGLIDSIGYEEDFDKQVETLFGGKVEYVKNYGGKSSEEFEKMLGNPFAVFSMLPALLNPPKHEAPKEPHIAIVYATGPISTGKSSTDWQGKVSGMGCDTIVEALETTLADDNVKAVVLRVNSPGGSALASDQIWGAIQRVKAKKPVIASMGNVAASGGYWISMGCSAIVAQPSTITGSMGVVAMVPDPSQTLKEIGVNVEVVGRGPHADELSVLKYGASPLLKEVITRSMQKVYADFIRKASEGRRLPPARIEELAQGRVWTGREAEERGLVDQLGGLQDALALACVMGGGLPVGTTKVMEYPQPPNMMDAIEKAFDDMATVRSGVRAQVLDLVHELAGIGALDSLVAVTDALLSSNDPLGADRVQCVLPFAVSIR